MSAPMTADELRAALAEAGLVADVEGDPLVIEELPGEWWRIGIRNAEGDGWQVHYPLRLYAGRWWSLSERVGFVSPVDALSEIRGDVVRVHDASALALGLPAAAEVRALHEAARLVNVEAAGMRHVLRRIRAVFVLPESKCSGGEPVPDVVIESIDKALSGDLGREMETEYQDLVAAAERAREALTHRQFVCASEEASALKLAALAALDGVLR